MSLTDVYHTTINFDTEIEGIKIPGETFQGDVIAYLGQVRPIEAWTIIGDARYWDEENGVFRYIEIKKADGKKSQTANQDRPIRYTVLVIVSASDFYIIPGNVQMRMARSKVRGQHSGLAEECMSLTKSMFGPYKVVTNSPKDIWKAIYAAIEEDDKDIVSQIAAQKFTKEVPLLKVRIWNEAEEEAITQLSWSVQ